MELFHFTSHKVSSIVTRNYSSSFYLSTTLLEPEIRTAIHGIYGFVRYADEIVDTFHDFDKVVLINEFEKEMQLAIERGISLNPVLDAFQIAVNRYKIPYAYIDAFMKSMKMDISKKRISQCCRNRRIHLWICQCGGLNVSESFLSPRSEIIRRTGASGRNAWFCISEGKLSARSESRRGRFGAKLFCRIRQKQF